MSAKVSDEFFVRRRSADVTTMPQITKVEDGKYVLAKCTVSTMTESLSPLLNTMKLFGLYFDCESKEDDKKWNLFTIHSLIGVILAWTRHERVGLGQAVTCAICNRVPHRLTRSLSEFGRQKLAVYVISLLALLWVRLAWVHSMWVGSGWVTITSISGLDQHRSHVLGVQPFLLLAFLLPK